MVTYEDQLQAKCTQWFWNTYIAWRRLLFHVDNNSWNEVIGARKKALGVVQGVSDLVLVCGQVIFIEMKTPTGKQTDEQKDFQAKVEIMGYRYEIIRSFEQFQQLIWQVIGKL